MAKLDKTLCKWKKADIEDRLDDLHGLVNPPRFVCARCARVAAKKKHLCKPVAFDR